ncbi:hypothetical protein BBF96_08215 [Anoxybacter fermentans]|uniref:DUF6385 domain-containing protein n=1 Tax=Anoxybacter fermentans TaxID=1323375 RepID=A0A3Q9HSD2_9FIRM|nr:DUF6385 domain-containing protein [Anoxybacter fermentans]AZR73368.1 hypothetical protein BBF96_08215 [Anoxybacter fermentans]
MPNYHIRNLDVTKLKTQIYGSTDTAPLATDEDGFLKIRSISDAITVNIDGTVAIRDLTANSDSILIYGYDGTNIQRIKTDTDGNIRTNLTARDFTELTEKDLASGDAYTNSQSRNTSQYSTYSFAVYNTGDANSVDVILEVSPDNQMWATDVGPRTIAAGDMEVLYPASFLKYTRISYKSTTAGQSTTLDIFFQAQI